ncbi:MAG TPA: c-type cytochrome, partial [Paracoccaceae bacterium]|nr:c-type cytochrome [Paracoccaceae bacterium]
MKCVLLTLAALALLGLIGAGAVVGFGLYNVSAAAGHLPGVSWVLHTTFRNSVRLRAPDESQVPALTDDMAAIGARHYDTACRPCHAAPGERRTWTMRSMEPEPPHIVEAVQGWEPRHLFWIALNGVKMTGMPHWPAENRRDEAWMMAAFLDRVGAMSAAEYAELTERPAADDALVSYCAMCHGLHGAGRGNARMPRLDILGAPYIAASLSAYRDGLRHSGIMQQAASHLTDEQIAMLAERFGAEEPVPAAAPEPPPEALVAAGRELALGGPDSTGTPACRACHGPWPARRSPLFPTLVGQRMEYLAIQLELWKDGHRGGHRRAHLMHQVAELLDKQDIDALA